MYKRNRREQQITDQFGNSEYWNKVNSQVNACFECVVGSEVTKKMEAGYKGPTTRAR